MTKWLWQLKWALVIAIFAGPAIAYFSWKDGQRIDRVMANGAELTAHVDSGIVHHGRRGRRSYELQISWQDAGGVPHSAYVDISSGLAGQIFTEDTVLVEETQIRYLASETDEPVVVVDDAVQQKSNDQDTMWLGIIAGIAGLLLSPLWFWIEARNKRKQDDDIDATLAQMRAGQQQP